MNTKSQLASTDPTFETKGPMGIFLCNRTDNGGANAITTVPTNLSGMWTMPQQASLTFIGQPPPAWVQGTDWKIPTVPAGNFYALAQDQFPSPTSNTSSLWRQGGSTCVMSITDRSSNKVVQGAQYIFDQPCQVGSGTQISLHFIISGVTGGSTVLPGFGVWNLKSRPGAWTFLSPTSFDGVWSVQLRSDDFLDYATLSVTYVPFNTLTSGPAMSRLFYSVSGSARATYPFQVTSSQVIVDAPDAPGTPLESSSSIDIFRASTEFTES